MIAVRGLAPANREQNRDEKVENNTPEYDRWQVAGAKRGTSECAVYLVDAPRLPKLLIGQDTEWCPQRDRRSHI